MGPSSVRKIPYLIANSPGIMLTLSLLSTGEDSYSCPDQSIIAVPLIEQLIASASGKDAEGKPLLTPKDLSQALSQRLADSQMSTNQPEILDYLQFTGCLVVPSSYP
jgi:hypothetical protein